MSSQQNNLLLGLGLTAAVVVTSTALLLTYWPEDYTPSALHSIYLNLLYSDQDVHRIEQLDKFQQASKILTIEVDGMEKRLLALKSSQLSQPEGHDDDKMKKSWIALKKELLEYSNDIDHIYTKLDALNLTSTELRSRRKSIVDKFSKDAKRVDDLLAQLSHVTF